MRLILWVVVLLVMVSCSPSATSQFVAYCKQPNNKLQIQFNPDHCVCIGQHLDENYEETQKMVLAGYVELLRSSEFNQEAAVLRKAKLLNMPLPEYQKRLSQVASAIGFHYLACNE